MAIYCPTAIKIAADSIEQLRRCDVFRLLDTYADDRQDMAEYIRHHRPDLAGEVTDCLMDL